MIPAVFHDCLDSSERQDLLSFDNGCIHGLRRDRRGRKVRESKTEALDHRFTALDSLRLVLGVYCHRYIDSYLITSHLHRHAESVTRAVHQGSGTG